MNQNEKHRLESAAIALEQAAESTSYYVGRQPYMWSRKTPTAFRKAARILRKRIEEEL